MNLPETYAAVCAKRPELAVDTLQHYMRAWWYHGDAEGHDIAAALILARWVEALPVNYWIGHLHSKDHMPIRWQVCGITAQEIIESPNAPTPLEALAAYWLGETT